MVLAHLKVGFVTSAVDILTLCPVIGPLYNVNRSLLFLGCVLSKNVKFDNTVLPTRFILYERLTGGCRVGMSIADVAIEYL